MHHKIKKPLILIWLFHKKLFKYALILVVTLAILTLILSGVLTGVLYYANQHGYLKDALNKDLGMVSVLYDTANVSWHHLDPNLTLTKVIIKPTTVPKAKPLEFDRVSISFAIWSSLVHFNLVTDEIDLSGFNLNMVQNQDGSFSLVGFDNSDNKGIPPAVMKWFLAQNEFNLDNFNVKLALHNGQTLHAYLNQMTWSQHFGYHFSTTGSIKEVPAGQFRVEAFLKPQEENPLDLKNWLVEFSGSFSGKDFTPLLAAHAMHNISFVSGGGDVHFQGSIAKQDLKSLQVYIDLKDLNLARTDGENLLQSKFDEAILWNALPTGGWTLTLKPLNESLSLKRKALTVHYEPEGDLTWVITAKDMDLGLIGQWVSFWFPPTSYTGKTWQELSPSGTLKSLKVEVGPKGGQFNLVSPDFRLGQNQLFPKGWPETAIETQLNWTLDPNSKTFADVSISKASLQNDWLNVALAGQVRIPKQDKENPYLNLKGTLSGQDLEKVKQFYIPQAFIDKDLADWLNQSLVKVPKVKGSFAVQGYVNDLPYANKKGLLQIALQVSDADILFWPGWPEVIGINANLLFKNQAFSIDASHAITDGVALQNVHFSLPDTRPEAFNQIVITGNAKPTGDQLLGYLAKMPIASPGLSKWLNEQSVSGSIPVKLKITIPVDNKPLLVQGSADFAKNDWAFKKGASPVVEDMSGVLYFLNDKLTAHNFELHAIGQDLTADIPQAPFDDFTVIFDKLSFLGQDFPGLKMNVDSRGVHTVLNFSHPLVQGNLYIADGGGIVADFSQLHLPIVKNDADKKPSAASQATAPTNTEASQTTTSTSTGAASTTEKTSTATSQEKTVPETKTVEMTQTLLGSLLAKVPALKVTVKELDYGSSKISQFFWESIPLENGIQIQHVNLTDPDISLTASGQIQTLEHEDHFAFKGTLGSENYGNLLSDLHLAGVLADGSGQVHFDLSFAGSLAKPIPQSLNGSIEFGLSNGKLLQVNSGFARIFGLVSLDTIFSTLSLNFQKMLSGGLSFDGLSGGYTIKNGVATSEGDGLKMSGPSLSLVLKGQIDLVTQTLDQTATVMPQVGTSLAVAAGFVGGPVIGVATFLADKILGNTVFKSAGFRYCITGSFDKPVVKSLTTPSGEGVQTSES